MYNMHMIDINGLYIDYIAIVYTNIYIYTFVTSWGYSLHKRAFGQCFCSFFRVAGMETIGNTIIL